MLHNYSVAHGTESFPNTRVLSIECIFKAKWPVISQCTWPSPVVKALRYKSEGPGIDSRCRRFFFSVASDSSMCPGVDSASKNEYQVNPGRKGGRCVRLTTYHVHVPMSRNLRGGGLTSWNPVGLFRPVMGQLYFYLAILQQLHTCYACRPSACFTLYWRNFVCDVHTEATHKKYKNYVLLSRVLSSNF